MNINPGISAQSMLNPIRGFGQQSVVGGTAAFVSSNSMVAKVAFLLLIVILF